MHKITAQQAADYFVWLAANEQPDDPDYLTPLKLQKLLYFAQGWAFAEWDAPLFDDRIEAWRYGPVVPSVYRAYKGRERLPIVPEPDAARPEVDRDAGEHLHAVWNAYKQYSEFALSDLTHAEPPYIEAYSPDANGRCTNEIDADSLRRAFKARSDASTRRFAGKRDRLLNFAKANTQAFTGRTAI